MSGDYPRNKKATTFLPCWGSLLFSCALFSDSGSQPSQLFLNNQSVYIFGEVDTGNHAVHLGNYQEATIINPHDNGWTSFTLNNTRMFTLSDLNGHLSYQEAEKTGTYKVCIHSICTTDAGNKIWCPDKTTVLLITGLSESDLADVMLYDTKGHSVPLFGGSVGGGGVIGESAAPDKKQSRPDHLSSYEFQLALTVFSGEELSGKSDQYQYSYHGGEEGDSPDDRNNLKPPFIPLFNQLDESVQGNPVATGLPVKAAFGGVYGHLLKAPYNAHKLNAHKLNAHKLNVHELTDGFVDVVQVHMLVGETGTQLSGASPEQLELLYTIMKWIAEQLDSSRDVYGFHRLLVPSDGLITQSEFTENYILNNEVLLNEWINHLLSQVSDLNDLVQKINMGIARLLRERTIPDSVNTALSQLGVSQEIKQGHGRVVVSPSEPRIHTIQSLTSLAMPQSHSTSTSSGASSSTMTTLPKVHKAGASFCGSDVFQDNKGNIITPAHGVEIRNLSEGAEVVQVVGEGKTKTGSEEAGDIVEDPGLF